MPSALIPQQLRLTVLTFTLDPEALHSAELVLVLLLAAPDMASARLCLVLVSVALGDLKAPESRSLGNSRA